MENLTIAERAPIVIDGCLIPFEVYDRVKALARNLGKWQFIGVEYDQPAELKPKPCDPDNFWIDDKSGERIDARTGERHPQ